MALPLPFVIWHHRRLLLNLHNLVLDAGKRPWQILMFNSLCINKQKPPPRASFVNAITNISKGKYNRVLLRHLTDVFMPATHPGLETCRLILQILEAWWRFKDHGCPVLQAHSDSFQHGAPSVRSGSGLALRCKTEISTQRQWAKKKYIYIKKNASGPTAFDLQGRFLPSAEC